VAAALVAVFLGLEVVEQIAEGGGGGALSNLEMNRAKNQSRKTLERTG